MVEVKKMKSKFLLSIVASLLIVSCSNNTPQSELKTTFEVTAYKEPDKLDYLVGEYFDPTGLAIAGVFYDTRDDKIEKETKIEITYKDDKEDLTFTRSLETELTTDIESVTVIYKNYESEKIIIPITVSEEAETTITINFNNFVFEGTSKEISTSNPGSYEEALKDFINTDEVEYLSGIITSGYSGLKKIDYSDCSINPFNILQVSSGSASGKLTLKFADTIKKAKVRAQAYYKVWMKTYDLGGNDPYPVYSLDADTTIAINDTSWELPSCEYNDKYEIVSMPEIEEKEFTINSKNLVLDDIEYTGRFFIHSIELTF